MKPSLILIALRYQRADDGLWMDSPTTTEAYLQDSIRDLHKLIEDDCPYALARIKARSKGIDFEDSGSV